MGSAAADVVSAALLDKEREKAERRLAVARLITISVASALTALFMLVTEGRDLVVQQRAVALLSAGAIYSFGWWAFIRRRRHCRSYAYVSTSVDLVFVLLLIVNWSIFPPLQILPTQAKFAPGYSALLVLLILTSLRFDYRTLLVLTLESAAGYSLYLGFLAWFGGVQFTSSVEHSFAPDAVNSVDVGARVLILLISGGLLAYLDYRVEGLVVRSVRATEQKARLRQFVSTNVVDEIESGRASLDLSGHRRRVTIMFCDIRGFTPLSEKMPPEALLELLNGYYEVVAAEIFRSKGTLDKYMGDGIMAIFGAPVALENSSLAAVRCALAMLREVETYGRARGLELHAGIGLHTAEVVVGNLGTRSYKNYTAVGEGVNLAARIESATRTAETPLLFSATIKDQLPADLPVRPMGDFALKGVSGAIALFSVDEAMAKSGAGPEREAG